MTKNMIYILFSIKRLRVSNMKKKLGDMTIEEMQDLCNKRDDCVNCPFIDDYSKCFFDADIDLDQEIEVEENV